MRTYVLYGALAVAGCASPEQAFPRLADVAQPLPPSTTLAQRAELQREIQAAGDSARRAGEAVRAGSNEAPAP